MFRFSRLFIYFLLCTLATISACKCQRKPSKVNVKTEEDAKKFFTKFLQTTIDTTDFLNDSLLRVFYIQKEWGPVWTNDTLLNAQGDELLKILLNVRAEGLNPEDYHNQELITLYQSQKENKKAERGIQIAALAKLDAVMSDAYFQLAQDIFYGTAKPRDNDSLWVAVYEKPKLDFILHLNDGLQQGGVAKSIWDLEPEHQSYHNLKKMLAYYLSLKDSVVYPMVKDGPKLKKDTTCERVMEVRARLLATNELEYDSTIKQDYFDETLFEAVKIFQRKNGLFIDGIVGKSTVKALNRSVEDYIQIISANMERWRWMPADIAEDTCIWINLAGYTLDVLEKGKSVMNMKIVCGKKERKTPVLNSAINQITLNPDWTVPPTILKNDAWPQLMKDPKAYLEKKFFKIYRKDGTEVHPDSVNWKKYSPQTFPYKLREAPSEDNTLGQVKFSFPNPFTVYMHDTHEKNKFNSAERAFSSGCVRVQRPIDLLYYFFADTTKYPRAEIDSVLASDVKTRFTLKKPVELNILYFTAWVDTAGIFQVRNDVYKKDSLLLTLMGLLKEETDKIISTK